MLFEVRLAIIVYGCEGSGGGDVGFFHAYRGRFRHSPLLPLPQDVPANTLTNATSCERNITDVLLMVTQTVTDNFDATINIADPFYVRSAAQKN